MVCNSSTSIALGSSDEEEEEEKRSNRSNGGTVGSNDVFKDVREFNSVSSASVGGIRKRSVLKASGEELVRQLQELERNNRLGYFLCCCRS